MCINYNTVNSKSRVKDNEKYLESTFNGYFCIVVDKYADVKAVLRSINSLQLVVQTPNLFFASHLYTPPKRLEVFSIRRVHNPSLHSVFMPTRSWSSGVSTVSKWYQLIVVPDSGLVPVTQGSSRQRSSAGSPRYTFNPDSCSTNC